MAKEPNPPNLTGEDRAAFAAILAKGKTLPCGGRTWEGPFNGTTPIYRMADTAAKPNQVSVRRLVHALRVEDETGTLEWPTKALYSEHWGCVEHLTPNRASAAKEPPPPAEYVRVWAPQHPLATRAGLVLEHRAVLHDRLGDDSQPCHWCQLELRWDARQGEPDELTVDHLDGEKANNDPANLVPACRPCNARRGVMGLTGPADEAYTATEPQAQPQAPDQGPQPDTPRKPRKPEAEQEDETSGAFETIDRALRVLADRPKVRAAVILLALFLAGLFGSAWVLSSPAGLLPGTTVERRPAPPATTTTPEAPATSATMVEGTTTSTQPTPRTFTPPTPCYPGQCNLGD